MHPARRLDRGRVGSVVAALGTLLAGLAMAAAPSAPGPWSAAFLLAAPAIPAAVLWRALDPPARFVLAGGAAVVVDAVVAQVMLATDTWSPPNGVVAVGVVSAVIWLGTAASWNFTARDRLPSSRGHRPSHERAGQR